MGGKKNTGLGRALMKQRFKPKYVNEDGLEKNYYPSEQHLTLDSVTEQNDLQEFMMQAELLDRDFTASRELISIVTTQSQVKKSFSEYESLLTIPKRPEWDSETTKEQLIKKEKESFLDWRRSLVYLEEEKGLILTPFEKNIEIWRQLWRVVERSELVCQIVDARHPLFFKSNDMIAYSRAKKSEHVLLVNKADLLSKEQRIQWAEYFEAHNIDFVFFSAHMAKEKLDLEQSKVDEFGMEVQQDENMNVQEQLYDDKDVPLKARILGAQELLDQLKSLCPESEYSLEHGKRTIGFVGYPNVGKSSTLNALVGITKVAVGSTPGKTKHFQTIHLPDIVLCDCPGLVFPSFASTKAEMVIYGVLPIDQLRDHIPPTQLVCERIPRFYLESIYGIKIKTLDLEGLMEDRQPTAEELLSAYAIARGFAKSVQGNPDEARASRYILKDYVQGKLLYVEPPTGKDGTLFNQSIYEDETLISRQLKKIQIRKVQEQVMTSKLDREFFEEKHIQATSLGVNGSKNFSRTAFPFQKQAGLEGELPGKKSHKKPRRKKVHAHWTKE